MLKLSLILVSIFFSANFAHAAPSVLWTMVNVNYTDQQGDAHVLKFPDGKVFLIDVGPLAEAMELVNFLKSQGISSIDTCIISHPHKDHYGGLGALMQAKIQMKRVYFNVPDALICDVEKPWGCDLPHIISTIEALKSRGSKVLHATPGLSLYSKNDINLKILYAYDGINTPIGRTDVNDTSLIIQLSNGKTRALFTGDLNQSIGAYLAKSGKSLVAELLKVPHHGTEGLAPNEFFDAVNPKAAFVPSPKKLWLSDRSERTRKYFLDKKIPAYVNGIHGTVTTKLSKDSYEVEAR